VMAGEDGQAAVELALVTPLLFVLLLAVVQVGLVVRDQVLVVDAAREGARAAAVDPAPDAGQKAAGQVPGLNTARMRVLVTRGTGPGATVRVDVEYRAPTDVPLLGGFAPSVPLHGTAVLRIET
jgi:Flp pilus assembly protein TadG